MIRDSGFPAARRLLSGIDDIGDDIRNERANIPYPHFPIVVVEEVIYDPVNLTEEDKQKLRDKVSNPELVDRIPRNSIVGTVITREINKSNNVSQIFFPCSQFNVSPLKPGEQAFVFFSDPYRSLQLGYWFCRVPEPLDTDDINFTHADRKFEYNIGLSTAERAAGEELSPPGFENGDQGVEDALTTTNSDDYENINNEAKANSVVVKEPVARKTKRPGDYLIQGSNGASITLGMDRISEASATPLAETATIDIVVNYNSLLDENAEPQGNAPRVITNARGELEVDKNPKKKNKTDNVAEGDPDFENDKSRIYVTAKSDIDGNFSIDVGEPSGNVAGIVLKSDSVRLIARNDLKIQVGDASVLITSDGNITFIPGPGGIIKLGENANKAIVCGDGVSVGGIVGGTPLVTSMGGALATGLQSQGFFATKVLIE